MWSFPRRKGDASKCFLINYKNKNKTYAILPSHVIEKSSHKISWIIKLDTLRKLLSSHGLPISFKDGPSSEQVELGKEYKETQSMASSDSQIDKPQSGRPKRAGLPDVNRNTGAQSINTERAS